MCRALRLAAAAGGGVLSVEPYTAAEVPATPEQVKASVVKHIRLVNAATDILYPVRP
jgi:hypothetical protein